MSDVIGQVAELLARLQHDQDSLTVTDDEWSDIWHHVYTDTVRASYRTRARAVALVFANHLREDAKRHRLKTAADGLRIAASTLDEAVMRQ